MYAHLTPHSHLTHTIRPTPTLRF
uniref:Uncharacterized protein n=1 Tax=Arundo donax TaxID=35708 RepID=A0A0A8YFB1_ARUDO